MQRVLHENISVQLIPARIGERTCQKIIVKSLKGYCTSFQILAYFVLCFKIINTFLKITYASYCKLFKELKNGIEILVGHALFKLKAKTVKIMFGSIIQEPLGLP